MKKRQNSEKRKIRCYGAWGRLVSDVSNRNGNIFKKAREVLVIEAQYTELRNENIDADFGNPGLRAFINTAGLS